MSVPLKQIVLSYKTHSKCLLETAWLCGCKKEQLSFTEPKMGGEIEILIKEKLSYVDLKFFKKSPLTGPQAPPPAKPWTPTPKGKKASSHFKHIVSKIFFSVLRRKTQLRRLSGQKIPHIKQ